MGFDYCASSVLHGSFDYWNVFNDQICSLRTKLSTHWQISFWKARTESNS